MQYLISRAYRPNCAGINQYCESLDIGVSTARVYPLLSPFRENLIRRYESLRRNRDMSLRRVCDNETVSTALFLRIAFSSCLSLSTSRETREEFSSNTRIYPAIDYHRFRRTCAPVDVALQRNEPLLLPLLLLLLLHVKRKRVHGPCARR